MHVPMRMKQTWPTQCCSQLCRHTMPHALPINIENIILSTSKICFTNTVHTSLVSIFEFFLGLYPKADLRAATVVLGAPTGFSHWHTTDRSHAHLIHTFKEKRNQNSLCNHGSISPGLLSAPNLTQVLTCWSNSTIFVCPADAAHWMAVLPCCTKAGGNIQGCQTAR